MFMKLGVLAVLLVAVFAVAYFGNQNAQLLAKLAGQGEQKDTISVSGSAQIKSAPDTAYVYVGISTLKPTAAEAQAENAQVINRMSDVLMSLSSVQVEKIETDDFSIYEEREYVPNPKENESSWRSLGYRATHTIRIKTPDVERTGTLIDVALASGANKVDRVSFELSDAKRQDVTNEALKQASQVAKKKAETTTCALGVMLGKVTSISTSNVGYQPYNLYKSYDTAGAAAAPTTVAPSDVTVSADVSVVYAISQ
jgi:uncharacterized protein YggE